MRLRGSFFGFSYGSLRQYYFLCVIFLGNNNKGLAFNFEGTNEKMAKDEMIAFVVFLDL